MESIDNIVKTFVDERCLLGNDPSTGQHYRVNAKLLRETFNEYSKTFGSIALTPTLFTNILLRVIPSVSRRKITEGYIYDNITISQQPRCRIPKVVYTPEQRAEKRKEHNKKQEEKRKNKPKPYDTSKMRPVVIQYIDLVVTNANRQQDDHGKERYNKDIAMLSSLMTDEELEAADLVIDRLVKPSVPPPCATLHNYPVNPISPLVSHPKPVLRLKIINDTNRA